MSGRVAVAVAGWACRAVLAETPGRREAFERVARHGEGVFLGGGAHTLDGVLGEFEQQLMSRARIEDGAADEIG